MSSDVNEQTILVREILKWIKFIGLKEVKGILTGELCDGVNTMADIVSQSKKSAGNIRGVMSTLRRKGLIRLKSGSTDIYEQRF